MRALHARVIQLIVQGVTKDEEQILIREPLISAVEAVTGPLPNLHKLTTRELITLHHKLL